MKFSSVILSVYCKGVEGSDTVFVPFLHQNRVTTKQHYECTLCIVQYGVCSMQFSVGSEECILCSVPFGLCWGSARGG